MNHNFVLKAMQQSSIRNVLDLSTSMVMAPILKQRASNHYLRFCLVCEEFHLVKENSLQHH